MKKPPRLSPWVISCVLKAIGRRLACQGSLGPWLLLAPAIFMCVPGSLFGAYTPYYTDPFNPTTIDSTKWYINGSLTPSIQGYGISGDGSLISKVTPPAPSTDYQVETGTLFWTTNTSVYVQYLRATSDAVSGPTPSGSYYAIELQNPTFPSNQYGTATLAVYKRVGGVITQLGSTVIPVAGIVSGSYQAATYMRSVIRGQQLTVYVNGIKYFSLSDSSLTSGQPGVGVRGSYVRPANLGPIDAVAPPAINGQTVVTSEFPTQVDFQWQAASDDANGVGVAYYQIQRNGGSLQTLLTPEFSDATVSAATSYTYTLYGVDFHQNVSPGTSITVTTPPAGAVDPRRTGVRATGSYWGAQGEQIDTLSGNLNFSLPLMTARGRTGWSVPVGLSYNSQLWRQDPGGIWKLGRDVGYGFGWKLQAGSITPYWSDPFSIHHYTFTDASGAEYRLDVNTNGVWTSREGIYLSYDSNSYRLYFPSGMFWTMGSVSAGTEQDAGTRYPTTIQDSNGNQIYFHYKAAVGSSWINSSARIWRINEVRGFNQQYTYDLTYNTDAIPHLTGVTNMIGTSEKYTLTYLSNQTLNAPFGAVSFGTTSLLQNVTVTGLGLGHTFEYAGSGSGELTKVTLPYGGALRWAYQSFTFTGNRTLREVANRYLTKAGGATETNYAFAHDPGDSARTIHALTTLNDPSGVGQKAWLFTTTGTWQMGLISSYEERGGAGQAAIQKKDFTWTQDAAGNPYASAVLTTLDPGQSYQKQSKMEQTLNVYGSVTQSKIYDFGNLVTPARTYTHTYLTGTNYSSRYINNRLTTSQVSDGTQTITMVTNTYDGASTQTPLGVLYGHHDTTNYGTGLMYRGNVTRRSQQGGYTDFRYDYTGTTKTATDNLGYNVASTPADYSNNDVPGVITPNGNTNLNTSLTYSGFFGVTSKTDPNTSTSTIGYDGYARPQNSVSPHGATTTYAYTNSPPTTKATTNGRWVKTTMDGLGRTIKVETADSTNTVYSVVDTEYDSCACSPLGKIKRASQPYAPGATVYWTTNTYDALGRTVSVTLPGGTGTTTYLYQGNTTKVTDPAGKWKTYTTDALGNLTKVTEPNPAGGADLDSNYTYNLFNRLTQTSMTRSSTTQTRTFTYDNTTQRLMSVAHPESGSVTYTYNADGTVAAKVDAKNQKIAYTYDSYKRVTQIQRYPVSTAAENVCQRVYFWYDTDKHDPSNVYGFQLQNGWGRLTSVEWYVSPSPACTSSDQLNGTRIVERYSYTSGGLAIKKRLHPMNASSGWPTDAGTLVSSTYMEAVYTYNNEGQTVSVTYPGDTQTSGPWRTYTYSFDSLKRPNKLTDNQATPLDWVKDVLYGPGDQMTQIKFTENPNIYYTETRSYNARQQLTQISTTGTTTFNTQYVYSVTQNNGQISQSIDAVSGETVDYTYDSLNRLITAATTGPQWGLSFGYDGFGNRLTQTVTKGSAPSSSLAISLANNRITTSGYSYDSNGNLTTMPYGAGSMTLTYDVENRVIQAVNSNGTEQYGYSPDNRRVYQKTPSGAQWIHFYGAGGDRLRTYTYFGNGIFSVLKTNLYFAGRLIVAGNTVAFIDGLGSDRKGARYYPYGQEITSTGNDRDKFATYFRDSSTGLDYAWNRYYASNLGRFLTPDRYGRSGKPTDPQTWNRYAYVGNDPTNRSDLSGLDSECYWTGEGIVCIETGPISLFSGSVLGRQTWDNSDTMSPFEAAQQQQLLAPSPTSMMNYAIDRALEALKLDDCAGLFRTIRNLDGSVRAGLPDSVGGGSGLLSLLTAAGNPHGYLEHRDLGQLPYIAITTVDPDGRSTIALNTNRGYSAFSYTGLQKRLTPVEGLAAVIIHELGHVAQQQFGLESTVLLPDGGGSPPGWSTSNQRTVEQRCFPNAPDSGH